MVCNNDMDDILDYKYDLHFDSFLMCPLTCLVKAQLLYYWSVTDVHVRIGFDIIYVFIFIFIIFLFLLFSLYLK